MPSKPARSRKPGPALSETRILRQALRIADEEGLDSLSMRRLADDLGVEAMSLYNHVASKDVILDGILDQVISEIEVPAGGGWKVAMHKRATSAHEAFLRHPWAAALLESRTNPSPVRLRYANSVLRVLREGGFSVARAYNAFLTLDSYVYGFTLQEVNWPYQAKEIPRAVQTLRPQISTQDFPHLIEVMDFVMRRHAPTTARPKRATVASAYATEFAFGLGLLLDGLEKARKQDARQARGRPRVRARRR